MCLCLLGDLMLMVGGEKAGGRGIGGRGRRQG